MKKTMTFAIALFAVAAMTSCKKDYTCSCTADDDFWDISYTANMKKGDAETWCDTWQDTWEDGGVVIDGWSCDLN